MAEPKIKMLISVPDKKINSDMVVGVIRVGDYLEHV